MEANSPNLASRAKFERKLDYSLYVNEPVELPGVSLIMPNPEHLGHIDFRHQKFSGESNESKIKNRQRVPVDSAYFCLHLAFEAKPVTIPI